MGEEATGGLIAGAEERAETLAAASMLLLPAFCPKVLAWTSDTAAATISATIAGKTKY